MHIDYSINEQDFVRAQRLAMKRSPQFVTRWMFSVIPGFGAVLLAIMIFLVATRGLKSNMPGLVVAVTLLLFPLITKRNIHRAYKVSTNIRGTLSVEADRDGVSFQGPTFSSRLAWGHYSRFLEDNHTFLLFQNPKIFNVVPKRGLTPEQIAELHELFSTQIRSDRDIRAAV
jgi:hypothetical protein